MWPRNLPQVLGIGAVFLLIVLFSSRRLSDAQSQHKLYCAQFGMGSANSWNLTTAKRKGYWTIGAREFDMKWAGAFGGTIFIQCGGCEAPGSTLPKPPFEAGYKILTGYKDKPCPWGINYCPSNYVFQYNGKDTAWCSSHHGSKWKPCVEESELQLRMYLVKQNGKVLKGWIHMELEIMDKNDEIEAFILQMRDRYLNSIGRFVNEKMYPGAKCIPSKSYLSSPTQYQFYPCAMASMREPLVSQNLMMARKDFYVNPNIVNNKIPDQPISRGVHFLFKMEEYWCNRHSKFMPAAFVLTKKNRERYLKSIYDKTAVVWRKASNYWLFVQWFGAADVILPNGELDCSEEILKPTTGDISPAAHNSWFLKRKKRLTFDEDSWMAPHQLSVCLPNPDGNSNDTIPSFSGRCGAVNRPGAARAWSHQCYTAYFNEEWEVYSQQNASIKYPFANLTGSDGNSYLERLNLTWYHTCQAYSAVCLLPNSKQDYEEMLSIPFLDTNKPIVVGHNDTRSMKRVYREKSARRFHGMLCTFVGFFVTPISILMSRYYKETFLPLRCFGVHVWYWVHMVSILIVITLTMTAQAAISPFLAIWGRSQHPSGALHRTIGQACAGTYFFLFMTGGYRFRSPGIGRVCCVTLHSLVGFLNHWLNFAAMFTSTWVPNSPSMNDCIKDRSDPDEGFPAGYSLVYWATAVWLALDILCHVVLSVLHILGDCRLKICRQWYLPMIPIVDNDQMEDMKATPIGLRKMILVVYVVTSLAVTAATCFLIYIKDVPSYCKSGNTTCNYPFGCTRLAKQYYKWYKNHT